MLVLRINCHRTPLSLSLSLLLLSYLLLRPFVAFVRREMSTDKQQLIDLDWKFALNVASSDPNVASGAARLYFKFTTTSNDDDQQQRRDIPLSLTLEQFYALVHQLEKAKLEMDVYA